MVADDGGGALLGVELGLLGEGDADAAGIQQVMSEELEKLRNSKGVEWVALSSIAEGSDILFARTARGLGMGWEAVLPLPPAEFRRDFHEEVWMQVETLLAEAEQVRIIGERTQRDDAYLDCGMETVNGCDLLLTVWDGEPSRGRGGTAEIVAYARELATEPRPADLRGFVKGLMYVPGY